jgi:hypothetical protein
MPTDLNTLDDWWNEGFDDFFDGAKIQDVSGEVGLDFANAWQDGWRDAEAYRNAIRDKNK